MREQLSLFDLPGAKDVGKRCTCRICGKTVLVVNTIHNTRISLDLPGIKAEDDATYNWMIRHGIAVCGYLRKGEIGYNSHLASCAEANSFPLGVAK